MSLNVFSRMGIRSKLALPIVGLIIIGMATVVVMSYRGSSRAIKAAVDEVLLRDVSITMKQVDHWLEGRKKDFAYWTLDPMFSEAVGDGFLAESARDEVCATLSRIKEEYSHFAVLILTDLEGNAVGASDAETVAESSVVGKKNYKDRGYFQRCLKGETVYSDVLVSKSTGKQVVALAAPVLAEGQQVGVLIGSIPMDALNGYFAFDRPIGESGYGYLMSPSGLIMIHPNAEYVMQLDLSQEAFGGELLSGGTGLCAYTLGGVPKLSAFATSEQTGWVFVEAAPEAELTAEARSVGYQQATVALIVVAAVIVVSFFVIAQLTGAIRGMVDRLKDIAEGEGDLTQRVDDSRSDELGELGRWLTPSSARPTTSWPRWPRSRTT
ncbi:HAMP domain-containing protein [Mucisphaera calidilacus]|uniref:Methyl-accepting chemotaxis protein McpB n=1 Tax=Mucisphaera calidilacus TaxID=2527982 RepID=A0A518BUH6_9BACT|nr:cache domain-containing protein [Mucisphaera calidilacus]QDU70587.1 Methyl-accepting chemotaxis protein McpB [Mucisphaera calidilacus]